MACMIEGGKARENLGRKRDEMVKQLSELGLKILGGLNYSCFEVSLTTFSSKNFSAQVK